MKNWGSRVYEQALFEISRFREEISKFQLPESIGLVTVGDDDAAVEKLIEQREFVVIVEFRANAGASYAMQICVAFDVWQNAKLFSPLMRARVANVTTEFLRKHWGSV